MKFVEEEVKKSGQRRYLFALTEVEIATLYSILKQRQREIPGDIDKLPMRQRIMNMWHELAKSLAYIRSESHRTEVNCVHLYSDASVSEDSYRLVVSDGEQVLYNEVFDQSDRHTVIEAECMAVIKAVEWALINITDGRNVVFYTDSKGLRRLIAFEVYPKEHEVRLYNYIVAVRTLLSEAGGRVKWIGREKNPAGLFIDSLP